MSSVMLTNPHVQVLSGVSLDFQERMAEFGVGAPARERATPCIVVATVRDDMEMSALSLGLAARNVRLLRLNVDDLAHVDIVSYLDELELMHGAERLAPRLFWARYLLHHPQRGAGVGDSPTDAVLRTYINQHNAAFIRTIQELSPSRVNQRATATGRLAQQRLAARSGIRVPVTNVTRNVATGTRYLMPAPRDRVIGKVIGEHWVEHPPGVLNGTFPRVLESAALEQLGVEPAPLIVQEFIDYEYELRIYAVGDAVVAYKVEGKSQADALWRDMERVTISATDLSPEHDASVRHLICELRIDFGAIDLLVTEFGELVFLEVNLVGDWRYFEKAAGNTRVSDAVLNHITTEMQ